MTTPLVALITALRKAADYDPRVEAPPEAVLWCDPNREFAPLLPALRGVMPNLLTFGNYDPAHRRGPAIWLRAALGRAIPAITWKDDAPAILYLPGIARETLRAAEDCPQHLRLLAWFVVGGTLFGHANSKDWTLRGFLSSKPAYGGLGLDVAQDEATREALATAAAKLFELPLAELQSRRVDAPWLLTLLVPDLEDDTLAWLGGGLTPQTDPARFAAFQARAKAELRIDPAKISATTAAARMLRQENGWGRVWDRFARSGRGMYEPAAAVLAAIDPPDLLSANAAIYATANARQETSLRAALAKLKDAAEATARDQVGRLAKEHAERCEGPWAARGQARLAEAVQHLARLTVIPPLPAQDAEAMADTYAETGWEADNAALCALEAVAPRQEADAIATLQEDRDAVVAALRALYAPRLQREALAAPGIAASRPAAIAEAGGERRRSVHRWAAHGCRATARVAAAPAAKATSVRRDGSQRESMGNPYDEMSICAGNDIDASASARPRMVTQDHWITIRGKGHVKILIHNE